MLAISNIYMCQLLIGVDVFALYRTFQKDSLRISLHPYKGKICYEKTTLLGNFLSQRDSGKVNYDFYDNFKSSQIAKTLKSGVISLWLKIGTLTNLGVGNSL